MRSDQTASCSLRRVWHQRFRSLILFAAIAIAVAPATAEVILYNANLSGVLDPGLVAVLSPGYALSFPVTDWATLTSDGTGYGFARLVTNFDVTGDFTAVTVGDRVTLSSAIAGLALYTSPPPSTWAMLSDSCFSGMAGVYSFVFPFTSGGMSETRNQLWFQIRRVGSTVYNEYNYGPVYDPATFTTLSWYNDSSLAGPVRVGLFLGQGSGDLAAKEARFDNLVIAVPDQVPEPSTICLLGLGVAGVWGMRSLRRRRPGRS
jgi:hypothetical protein